MLYVAVRDRRDRAQWKRCMQRWLAALERGDTCHPSNFAVLQGWSLRNLKRSKRNNMFSSFRLSPAPALFTFFSGMLV